MKKVMYIADNKSFIFSDLKHLVQEFTINNGCYPDIIEMHTTSLTRFRSLLLKTPPIDKLSFMGIKVELRNLDYGDRENIKSGAVKIKSKKQQKIDKDPEVQRAKELIENKEPKFSVDKFGNIKK